MRRPETTGTTGHSLGAIVANNISGRPDAQGRTGKISVTSGDGEPSELPIRNVIGFGTPKPSIWSNDVNYVQRVGYADIVANLATDEVRGKKLNQWASEPGGPQNLDRQRVHVYIPKNDLADGGHLQYNKSPSNNPLAKEQLPASLQYSGDLKLIGAYRNPAMGSPPPVDQSIRELEQALLPPKVQQQLDGIFPKWREWLGAETEERLQKHPPGVRNQFRNSLDAVLKTYLDGDRYKTAGPEERKQIIEEGKARLVEVVKEIAAPLAQELVRQKALDLLKNTIPRLPWN